MPSFPHIENQGIFIHFKPLCPKAFRPSHICHGHILQLHIAAAACICQSFFLRCQQITGKVKKAYNLTGFHHQAPIFIDYHEVFYNVNRCAFVLKKATIECMMNNDVGYINYYNSLVMP
jgi:hypothetical protein